MVLNYLEEVKTYKRYYVCAIDGSLFEISNMKELREEDKTQKNRLGDRESARARVSEIYDIKKLYTVRFNYLYYRQYHLLVSPK